MADPGIVYMINGMGVTSPDEERWSPVVVGRGLSGHEKRSPFWRLEWHRTVDPGCAFDWFPFDNTTLTSLVTRPTDDTREHETYSDVICESVVARYRRSVMVDIVATFMVNVG